jgi:hypothetical protein
MFDRHLLTAGQHCGKTHVVRSKPESEDDHIGDDLLADVIAHKHHHLHHHNHAHRDNDHGGAKKLVVQPHVHAV